ncbi:hypothetical protein NL676_034848 [Syzygium grande]|nr:hypothetical protein NL676_034848 [Syzygium grande]
MAAVGLLGDGGVVPKMRGRGGEHGVPGWWWYGARRRSRTTGGVGMRHYWWRHGRAAARAGGWLHMRERVEGDGQRNEGSRWDQYATHGKVVSPDFVSEADFDSQAVIIESDMDSESTRREEAMEWEFDPKLKLMELEP